MFFFSQPLNKAWAINSCTSLHMRGKMSLELWRHCMEEVGYNHTRKEFCKLSKLAEDIYNIAVVVDYFCSTQPEQEECYNLTPIIKTLRQNADLINAFFIDADGKKEDYN